MENSKIICTYCCKFVPKEQYEKHYRRHIYLKNKLTAVTEKQEQENNTTILSLFLECQETIKSFSLKKTLIF